MNQEQTHRVLSPKGKRVSSVTLVVIGLVGALVAVLAWPALDRVLWPDSSRPVSGEDT